MRQEPAPGKAQPILGTDLNCFAIGADRSAGGKDVAGAHPCRETSQSPGRWRRQARGRSRMHGGFPLDIAVGATALQMKATSKVRKVKRIVHR